MFDPAFRFVPDNWTYEQQRALAPFYLRNLLEAQAWALKAIHIGDGDLAWSHPILTSSLALQGRLVDACVAAVWLLENRPSFSISFRDAPGPARATEGWHRLWSGLRLASVPA